MIEFYNEKSKRFIKIEKEENFIEYLINDIKNNDIQYDKNFENISYRYNEDYNIHFINIEYSDYELYYQIRFNNNKIELSFDKIDDIYLSLNIEYDYFYNHLYRFILENIDLMKDL